MKNELDREGIKFNVYEYFNYCKEVGARRGVGVITDKQSILYTEINKVGLSTHEWLAMDIENAIHETNPKGLFTLRNNNIHYFSLGKELIIDLPTNGDLTLSQYSYLLDILYQVKEFNKENNTKTNILIACANETHFLKYNPYDIDLIIQELKELITKEIRIENEIIIGKTLDIKNQKLNMLYQLDLEGCKTLSDFYTFLKKAKMYYEDENYGELFESIMPNFLEIWNYIDNLEKIDSSSEFQEILTYKNIIEQIKILINGKLK